MNKKLFILKFRSKKVGYFSTLRKLDSYLYKEITRQHLDLDDFSVLEIELDLVPNKFVEYHLELY